MILQYKGYKDSWVYEDAANHSQRTKMHQTEILMCLIAMQNVNVAGNSLHT